MRGVFRIATANRYPYDEGANTSARPAQGVQGQAECRICRQGLILHSHRIYTGTFHALEARLIERVVFMQAGDPLAPVAVLVGSNLLASYLKRRLAGQGRTVANVHFYTFPDLAAKLVSAGRPDRPKPRLPHLGASLLLQDVLARETPEAFSRVAGFAGFRGALLDTFRDLRDAGVTPSDLEASLSGIGEVTPDRRSHLLGLAILFRHFRDRVAAYQDPAEDFRRAGAAAGQAAGLLGTNSLLIYGIYDVTGVQADFLRHLKDTLGLIYFIPQSGDEAARFAIPFLESRVRETGATPEALPAEIRSDGLGTLERRLFAIPEAGRDAFRQPAPSDGSFALLSVPGESRVAVEVIREVLRARREGVIAGFHQAAVILRRPEEDVPVLTEAFRLRRIPYFVHGGTPFSHRPLARAVLSIAGLEGEGFTRHSILTAMELIAAALPAAAAADWDVAQWRALVNDPRFLAGIQSWDAGVEALVRENQMLARRAEAGQEPLEEDASGRASLSALPARRRLESAEGLRKGWAALRGAAAGWPTKGTWSEWAQLLEEKFELLLGHSEDWPALASVFDDLGALGELAGEDSSKRQASRTRMVAAISEVLADLSRPEGRFLRTGVNLLSATAARGLRFPLVIIPGLEEGKFPARLRQDPLLLDAERMRIGRPPKLPLKSLRGEEEELLFGMAVHSAESRLVLISSRLDESSDRERIPSQFFLRAAAAARGAILHLNELTAQNVPGLRSISLDDPGPGKGQPAVDEGEIRLGLITENPLSAHAALAEIARAEPLLMNGPLAYDQARWQRRLTEFDGRILNPSLWAAIGRRLEAGSSQLSASRIEEYARCPYLFYLRRVLKLESWVEEEPLEGMDPLLRGQVIHAILEEFLRAFPGDAWTGTPMPVLLEALAQCASRMLEEGRPAAMPDLLWEIERDRLLQILADWLAYEKRRPDPELRPAHLERAFGSFPGEADVPAYRLQAGNIGFAFRGRIDRIDMSRDGRRARVIDYKTGSLPQTMNKTRRTLLMAGERIQLAIYSGALSVMPDLSDLRQVEAEYLHLQPGGTGIQACVYSSDELNAAIERLPGMLEIFHEGVAGGVFFARARGSVRPYGHCDYCDFLRICGKDREQRERHKSGDPAVARFAGFREIDGGAEAEP